MADISDGERLAKIEESISSIKVTLDRMYSLKDDVQDVKLAQATQSGVITGSKWMLGIIGVLASIALYLGVKPHL